MYIEESFDNIFNMGYGGLRQERIIYELLQPMTYNGKGKKFDIFKDPQNIVMKYQVGHKT